MRWLAAVALALALGSCGHVPYEDLPEGRFKGTLFVMWVGEGSASVGSGRFVFVPMPNDPLTFTRGHRNGTVEVIEPQIMYTDGGSIPKLAQAFEGFSPWGYAPGYMVHDWLFQARHCNVDGKANAAEQRVAAMTFLESADIMGETIKTLIAENKVAANDVAPATISSAVAGPISRGLWDKKGACPEPRISDEHMRQVKNALNRLGAAPAVRNFVEPVMGDAAQVVSVVRFN